MSFQLPIGFAFRVIAASLTGGRRSFRADAIWCTARLQPPARVQGQERIPESGPCLVAVNHFSRPAGPEGEAIGAWWLALCISANLPVEVHWILTSGWTYPDWWRSHTLTPLSSWLFRRLAAVYGFVTMPPMPPRPHEVVRRAQAVRRVINLLRQNPEAWIGLAPEGRDIPGGGLGDPPPGAGRFMLLLNLPVLPVGVYAVGPQIYVNFGPLLRLEGGNGLPAEARDRLASEQVMRAIAACLPAERRGHYSSQ